MEGEVQAEEDGAQRRRDSKRAGVEVADDHEGVADGHPLFGVVDDPGVAGERHDLGRHELRSLLDGEADVRQLRLHRHRRPLRRGEVVLGGEELLGPGAGLLLFLGEVLEGGGETVLQRRADLVRFIRREALRLLGGGPRPARVLAGGLVDRPVQGHVADLVSGGGQRDPVGLLPLGAEAGEYPEDRDEDHEPAERSAGEPVPEPPPDVQGDDDVDGAEETDEAKNDGDDPDRVVDLHYRASSGTRWMERR